MAVGWTWSGQSFPGGANSGGGFTWSWFGEVLHTVALESLRPNVLLKRLGQQYNMPANRGKVFHIPKWNLVNPVQEMNIGGNTVSGATIDSGNDEVLFPDGHALSMGTEAVQIRAWGGYFKFTDVWMMIEEIPGALAGGVSQLAHGLAVVTDAHVRDDVLIGNFDGGTNGPIELGAAEIAWDSVTTTDTLRVDDLFHMYNALENKNAMTWPGMVYEGIFHPRCIHDLFVNAAASGGNLTMSDWLATTSGQGAFERNQLQVIAGITLNKSTISSVDNNAGTIITGTGSNGFDASPTATGTYSYAFAPGAFAHVSLAGGDPTLIVQPFGSGGTKDPFKREMTIAIRSFEVAKELDLANRAVVMATGATF